MSRFDTLLASGIDRLQAFAGESVSYQSAAGGAPRAITDALVSRRTELVNTDHGIEEREFADVTVSRDSTGIDAPAIRDSVVLTGDARPYAWTGRIPSVADEKWTLEFSRVRLFRQGAAQTMASS